MGTSGPSGAPAFRRWILTRRVCVALWLAFGFVLWNVLFDAAIADGAREYLTRQALYREGRGPAATIHGVMDRAASRGVRTATLAGGGVAAVGLVLVWAASRRRAARLPRGAD